MTHSDVIIISLQVTLQYKLHQEGPSGKTLGDKELIKVIILIQFNSYEKTLRLK